MAEDNKARVAEDYDASAAAYEAHWGPALAKLSERFIETLPLADAHSILDVGAGTGRLVRHLNEKVEGTAYGVDRSLGMLRRAPAESPRAVMDAERLAFTDEAFDAVLAMFVLFHLPDAAAGLREMRRVTKRGGTVAFTTWGDDDTDFRAFDVFDEVLDRRGAAEGRGFYSRYDPIESAEKCEALLSECGFSVSSVRAERMAHEWTEDDVIGFRTQVGYGRVRWDSLDATARPSALEDGRRALRSLPPEDLVLRDEVIYAVGVAR